MTGHDHPARNIFERRLDEVLHIATEERILEAAPFLPLRTANAVVRFLADHGAVVPEISCSYLLHLKALALANPLNWMALAQAEFITEPRPVRPRPCAELRPRGILTVKSGDPGRIIHGDFNTDSRKVPDGSVDCIVTSPPYADQRKDSYGGMPEKEYAHFTEWWVEEARRLLKKSGNMLIIIRPHVKDGREVSYVRWMCERIEQLGADARNRNEPGWIHRRNLVWVKLDAPPLGHNRMPRPAFEDIYWFSLDKDPYCKPKAAGRASDRIGLTGRKGVGKHVHNVSVGYASGTARASDVIFANVGGVDRSPYNTHTAQFPARLAETLIKIFCPPGGLVLDPFIGSGSTAIAAMNTGREFVGFERKGGYVNIARKRIKDAILAAEGA